MDRSGLSARLDGQSLSFPFPVSIQQDLISHCGAVSINQRSASFRKSAFRLDWSAMFRFSFREVFSPVCLRKSIAIVSLVLVFLLAQPVFAQSGSDSLAFFKNYFVTGDYVVGGVGLRGLGDLTGFATGTISIPDQNSVPAAGVPDGADIVGAFLYWQTVEKSQSTQAGQNGFFNGYAITGKLLGNNNAPVSWSGGGCAGSSNGTTTLRTYRADVRRFLKVVNGVVQGNASYQV